MVAPGSFSLQMNLLTAPPVDILTTDTARDHKPDLPAKLLPSTGSTEAARILNVYCCFKPVSLGLTFYTEIKN